MSEFGDDFGDDFSGDDVGAVMTRSSRGVRRHPALISRIPGAPSLSQKDVPLGFGQVASPAIAAAATANVSLTARPQLPFRGRRLVINVLRTVAGAATAVELTAILIGSRNQLASSQSVPAEIFATNATNVTLELDPSSPGIDVVLNFTLTAGAAIAAGDVIIQAGMIGDSIG